MRDALLKHFEIASKKNEVRWLKTAADCRPNGGAGGGGGDGELEDEWLVDSEDSE